MANFEVYNDYGQLALDDSWRYYELLTSGRKTVPGPSRGVAGYAPMSEAAHAISLNNDNTDRMPLVFLKLANPNVTYMVEVMNPQWAWVLAYDRASRQFVQIDVDYRVYAPRRTGALGNTGLQIFDANGQICYQSAMRPMRVNSRVRMSQASSDDQLVGYGPAVSQPFVCMNGVAGRRQGTRQLPGWNGTRNYYFRTGLCAPGAGQLLSQPLPLGIWDSASSFNNYFDINTIVLRPGV